MVWLEAVLAEASGLALIFAFCELLGGFVIEISGGDFNCSASVLLWQCRYLLRWCAEGRDLGAYAQPSI